MWVKPVVPVSPLFLSPSIPANRQTGQPVFKETCLAHTRKLTYDRHAVMPHKDAAAAPEAALSMDIPFWPQLPRLSYYEDMYLQASEHFPGIVLDMDNQTLAFSTDKFVAELEEIPNRLQTTHSMAFKNNYCDIH